MAYTWPDIALPWGPDVATFVEPKDDDDVLKTSILMILLTNPGERVMLPEFGSGIMNLLFDPLDSETVAQIKARIAEAIAMWDDRIAFVDFQVRINESNHQLECKVVFQNAKDPMATALQEVNFIVPVA